MQIPLLWLALLLFLNASCTRERDVVLPDYGNDSIKIRINEYSAAAPQSVNEFGVESDWIELYNAGDDTFKAAKHEWFITDDVDKKGLYRLPAVALPPKQFLLIWCDGADTVANAIHTNFKLSSNGESIAVYVLSGSDTIALDARQYGPQLSGRSEGRKPDGASTWSVFNAPTPGAFNQ